MTGDVTLTADAIHRLTLLTDPWLSCDDCFDQVDTVVEDVLGRIEGMSEPFRVHLVGCTACYDEALALVQLIAPEFALDQVAAAEAFVAAVNDLGSPNAAIG